jgi:hypothetical protein
VQIVQEVGFDDVKPRLDWLLARIAMVEHRMAEAEEILLRARQTLLSTQDWEDLPGVEVELSRLRAVGGDAPARMAMIEQIAIEAEGRGATIVYLRGALAIAEILRDCGTDDREREGLVIRALARSEQAGTAEITWRLSACLAQVAERRGQTKEAHGRYSHALRSMREIADRLSPANRTFYLGTAHAASVLSRLPHGVAT